MKIFRKIVRLFKKKKITDRWRYKSDGITKVAVENDE